MADLTWIKLDVGLFGNRKISKLRRMEHGSDNFVTWIFLLTQAGACNEGGKVGLSEVQPFTTEDLAAELKIPEEVIQKALDEMVNLRMIEIDEDGFIYIVDWETHQNAEQMERIREQNRIRKQRQREKERDVTEKSRVTDRDSHGGDKNREEKIREEKIREDITEEKAKPSPPPRHKYGEFKHVLLTDADLEKLKTEFTDWEERIQRLDEYIEMKGENYKNHYLTIKNWARRDSERGYSGKSAAGNQGKTGNDEGRVFGILI